MNYKSVKISENARIAKQSVITGDVTIGRDSCVLYFAVIRGDEAPVVIGEESNRAQCRDPWLYDRRQEPDRNGCSDP